MRRPLIVLAGIILLAASCGDDDDDNGGAASTAASTGAATSGAPTSGAPTSGGAATTAEGGGAAPVSLPGETNNKGTEEVSGDEVELELDDYYFEPTFLKAQPGATIHLTLANEGDDTHTFTSDALGVDQEVPAGEEAEVDVTLPQEGAVQFWCRFHQNMGMQGAFFFTEGDTISTGSASGATTATTGG